MGNGCDHHRQSEYLPENSICILDLVHVMEWLWKVAWCFFTSEPRSTSALVGGRASQEVAGGESGRGDSRDAIPGNQRGLKGQERNTVRVWRVFRWESRSDEERRTLGGGLSDWQRSGRGSASASGSKTAWSDRDARLPSGAQAMLDVRATHLNGEWNAFWNST